MGMTEETWIDWADARESDIVKGKDNFAWRVHNSDGADRLLVRVHDEKTWRGRPAGQVMLLNRGADLAVATLKVHAGAIEVGKQDEQGRWKQPVEYDNPAALHAHFYLFHGDTGDAPDLSGLVAAHRRLHQPEAKQSDRYVPHTHDPAYADV